MAQPPLDTVMDMARLPRAGTPARREWDRTIRQANELYPDWSWITIGRARFRRDTYEERRKRHHTGPSRRANRPDPCAVVSSR
jgi:hypothetical protein